MPLHHGRGVLVAFEGIDGAGKTTQLRALAESLSAAGQSVVVSREPTNSAWGQKIRRSAAIGRMPLSEEMDAFIRDRTEHANNLITPSLERGDIVLLDRYYYSTMAYQGARGADVETIRGEMERRFPIPDAVMLLDIPATLAMYRISQLRNDVPNDFERQSGLEEARRIFNALKDPLVHRIDGTVSIAEVHRQVVDTFINAPFKSRRCKKAYGCDDPIQCGFKMSDSCDWWLSSRRILPVTVLNYERSSSILQT